ncbi:MAG: 23S rRNA (pseudouridine(1915)-N(3))-methyltransferase RlmH [Bdellovibrionota bacterium]|nr:MAG: 23S rRNA (pseudouridine(1915)-N(3))-methyltransferase RlmH [Bdellovibrionota bacterium]
MLRIEIISFASSPGRHIAAMEQEYVERLSSWCGVEIRSEVESRKSRVLKELEERGGRCTRIMLDEAGDTMSSKEFAHLLSTRMNQGISRLAILIGPADGWEESDLTAADSVLSISKMTFTAHLCRLLILEQIYRAFSILRGTAYHRD